MFLLLRFLPILSAIITTVTKLLVFWYPSFLIYSIEIDLVIITATIFLMLGRSYNEFIRKKLFRHIFLYLIIPALLSISVSLFLIFLNQASIYYISLLFYTFLIFIFLENIFIYLYYPPKYNLGSLENISMYLSLLIIFLLFSSIFGLIIFVKIKIWPTVLISGIVTIFLVKFQMFINKINSVNQWLFIFTITLIIVELFSIILILPTSIYVNGLLLTSIFYILTGLSKEYLLQDLEKKVIIKYITITLILLTLTLITARWV